jgi:alanyl-tRNA synthetase
MTEKLYLDDAYTVSFRARVVSTAPSGQEGGTVVLDRSHFYPESGGQTSDQGSIGPLRVVDVQEAADGSVQHRVEGTGVACGESIECRIDWHRRFDHMQQHSGQHVLSRAFIATSKLDTVSFHMGEETCTIDLEGAGFDDEAVSRAEDLANAIVTENRPVRVRTVSVDELDGLGLRRSVPEGVISARLVEVEGFDIIPCCGTHIRQTGELGVIKVVRGEKVRGTQRVYFKVGGRAFGDFRVKHDILQALSARLTTSVGDIPARVEKLVGEGQQTRKDIKRLSQKLAALEAATLAGAARKVGDYRLIAHFFSEGDDGYLRLVSAELRNQPRTVVILGGRDGGVVCGAADGVAVDFTQAVVEPARAAGGSGGGKGTFAQLKLPQGADVRAFIEEAAHRVQCSLES